ncbi:endonuclease/exonuclease/phosphatase family domain-containing protein 1-like [Xenopus laevis]|uniref:Endonuclease/exonuclease/phosphatase family domain-containing protein 1-like n=2 Tax=Xenopus laevis TaxID=8355 RepID=A0A1L8GLJ1_XENLA|nr:endonuclease/exonuclease/phosphatase family domain-containing protein 1-like [Xenopus laevis]XP_041446227.1 endonuclease/exonuclease/phosphatase family domain-containing protein 1-like [Xenopus laevis]OCT84705.1 hypothetical protein XELAEV_18022861mg [Xenopus laevis]
MGAEVSCRRGQRKQRKPSLRSCPNNLPESCLDINKATEEELMTLPGVNRNLAQSITAHRRKIRGFRRVEDLALVTGVGAERMLELRPEICVVKSETTMTEMNGSRTIYDDVAMSQSNTREEENIEQKNKLQSTVVLHN